MCQTVRLREISDGCGVSYRTARFVLDRLAHNKVIKLPRPRGSGTHLRFTEHEASRLVLCVLLSQSGIEYKRIPLVFAFLFTQVRLENCGVKRLIILDRRYCCVEFMVRLPDQFQHAWDLRTQKTVDVPEFLTTTSIMVDQICRNMRKLLR